MVTSKSGQVLMEFCHIQTTMAMMLQFIYTWMGKKDTFLHQNSTGKSSWMKQRMRLLLLLDSMILTLMMFILMKAFALQFATRSQGMYLLLCARYSPEIKLVNPYYISPM